MVNTKNQKKFFNKNKAYKPNRPFTTKFKEDEYDRDEKVSDEKIWGGGDSIAWAVKKEIILGKFRQATLQRFIIPPVEGFGIPEPSIDNWITPTINGMNDNRNARVTEILGDLIESFPVVGADTTLENAAGRIANLANAQRAPARAIFERAREMNRQMISNIEIKRLDMMSQLPKRVSEWRKDNENFRERERKCGELFEKYFTKDVLSHITVELGNKDFAGAWTRLNDIYSIVGGGDPLSALVKNLYYLHWNPKDVDLDTFISEVRTKLQMAEAAGMVVAEVVKTSFLTDAIKKGSKEYDGIIEYSKLQRLDFEHTVANLMAKNRELRDERKRKEIERSYVAKDEKKKSNDQKTDKKKPFRKGVNCHYCGKEGHIEKDCYKKINEEKAKAKGDDTNIHVANTAVNEDTPNLVEGFQERIREIRGETGRNDKANAKKKGQRANVMIAVKEGFMTKVDSSERMTLFQVKCLDILSNHKQSKTDSSLESNCAFDMSLSDVETRKIEVPLNVELSPEKEYKDIESARTPGVDVRNFGDDQVNDTRWLVGDCKLNETRIYECDCERSVDCVSTLNSNCERSVELVPTLNDVCISADDDNLISVQNGPTFGNTNEVSIIDTHCAVELKTDVVSDMNHIVVDHDFVHDSVRNVDYV